MAITNLCNVQLELPLFRLTYAWLNILIFLISNKIQNITLNLSNSNHNFVWASVSTEKVFTRFSTNGILENQLIGGWEPIH